MASKITLDLSDQDEADFAFFLRIDAPSPLELLRKDYIDGNIKVAAAELRRRAIEGKRARLTDVSKAKVIALEQQQEADRAALIEAEVATEVVK